HDTLCEMMGTRCGAETTGEIVIAGWRGGCELLGLRAAERRIAPEPSGSAASSAGKDGGGRVALSNARRSAALMLLRMAAASLGREAPSQPAPAMSAAEISRCPSQPATAAARVSMAARVFSMVGVILILDGRLRRG